jgi:uncharacterized protein (TIGR03435 family)
LCDAQIAHKSPVFDAASIKPAAVPAPGRPFVGAPSGGPGTPDPGRVHYPFTTLKSLLQTAYDVKAFQIEGTSWVDTERFDLIATMPPGTTKDQFHVMLQNLLAQRFRLALHTETKQFPTNSLTVAKGGTKMQESKPAAIGEEANMQASGPLGPPKIGPDGFPELPAAAGRTGLFLMMMPGRGRLVGREQTMADLANRLTDLLSHPVHDATGLPAKYDFTLTFAQDGMSPPMGNPTGPGMMVPAAPPASSGAASAVPPASLPEGENLPNLSRALKEQLGLVLEPSKGPVKLIVIDHIEKTPVGNE